MRFRAIIVIAVFALLAAACSSTDSASSTAPPTTATSPTTAPDTSTTTAAATTTPQAAPTTTAAAPTPGGAQEIVDAKALAFSEAAPDDWDVSKQAGDNFDEGDFSYVPCLGADDFDLDEKAVSGKLRTAAIGATTDSQRRQRPKVGQGAETPPPTPMTIDHAVTTFARWPRLSDPHRLAGVGWLPCSGLGSLPPRSDPLGTPVGAVVEPVPCIFPYRVFGETRTP